jgi:hypothetical protein
MPTTKQMIPYLLVAVGAAMGVYFVALITGTDFSKVSAPPALFSPIPWWLFATYSIGGAAAMFPLFLVSMRVARPRLLAIAGILAGLFLMTPAPFLVTDDFLTIFWLTASHIALVAPLIALAYALPGSKQPETQN